MITDVSDFFDQVQSVNPQAIAWAIDTREISEMTYLLIDIDEFNDTSLLLEYLDQLVSRYQKSVSLGYIEDKHYAAVLIKDRHEATAVLDQAGIALCMVLDALPLKKFAGNWVHARIANHFKPFDRAGSTLAGSPA